MRSLTASIGWSAAHVLVARLSAVVAVPLVLNALGADLYAAWVLAGTLVMVQGLVDLGVGAATLRFVALGNAEGSRAVVVQTLRRSVAFYGVLSALVGVPLFIFATPIVQLVPYLRGGNTPAAAELARYTAIAFALTNGTLVAGALLQGLGRVASSFRAQALGWLLYVPVLAFGLAAGWGVAALGIAWLVAYGVQLLLMVGGSIRALNLVPEGPGTNPSWRELIGLGGQWQVASWADFASFQAPRIVIGVAMSSASLLAFDLGMRVAALAVAPFFAAYPVVLPEAAHIWARQGRAGAAEAVRRWLPVTLPALLISGAATIAMARPAIALWTGLPTAAVRVDVVAALVVGFVAHASTGITTSVLLGGGDVGPVVRYKLGQLALVAVLVAVAAPLGVLGVSLALAIAMGVPAALFHPAALRRLGLTARDGLPPHLRRTLIAIAVSVAVPGSVELASRNAATAVSFALTLVACIVTAVGAGWILGLPDLWRTARSGEGTSRRAGQRIPER